MDAPPLLTPERIDAMLSIMAEVCLESVVEAGQRQKTADDPEAFERGGRTLQRACRNLRQTIAMKQRHDREQERKAADGRRVAQDVRKDAERARNEAAALRRAQVRRHFDRVLWDEYEPDDVEDMLDVVHARLGDMVLDDDFLEAPIETLIQRLADEIGLGQESADDPPDPPASTPKPPAPAGPSQTASGQDRATPQASLSNRRGRKDGAESAEISASSANASAISAVESNGSAAVGSPERPPDPEPPREPYLPPWEQLKPGQAMPGGGGW